MAGNVCGENVGLDQVQHSLIVLGKEGGGGGGMEREVETRSGNDVGGRSGKGEKWREVEGEWEKRWRWGRGDRDGGGEGERVNVNRKWNLNSK